MTLANQISDFFAVDAPLAKTKIWSREGTSSLAVMLQLLKPRLRELSSESAAAPI